MEERIQKRVEIIAEDLRKQPDIDHLPKRKISWDEAVEYALKNNLEIRTAQVAIDDAERSVRRVFLDFVPGVNLDALLTKDINNLMAVSSSDVGYHANILFNIPSLTQVPMTYYSAKASLFRANKSMEMKKREVIAALYKNAWTWKIARSQYEMEKEDAAIKNKRDGSVSMADANWNERSRTLATELIKLMGNPDFYWEIDERTLPKFDWARYKRSSSQLDHLVLTMLAMEIEASRLNILGIKMRYFPELNVNFYSPSLFTSTGGTYSGVFADSGDMYVNMSLSWEIDTKLSIWDSLQSAKATHAILEKEVRNKALERKDKIQKLMKSHEDFMAWSAYIKKRANFLDRTVPLTLEEYKSNRQEIRQMTKELYNNQERSLETEAALIMEYGLMAK